MTLKTTAAAILAGLTALPMANARTWSLNECIDYAMTHNITIQVRAIEIEAANQSVIEAKDAFLPDVTAGAQQGFNLGRGLTSQNTYANRNTSNFQWSLGLNLPIFQGMSEYRKMDVAKAQFQQALYQLEAAKDDVTLNVIAQYLQALYADKVAESARKQLDYSTFEVGRQKTLVAEGKVPEADLYTAQAQQAQDSLQVVTALNDRCIALVELANMLQLKDAAEISAVAPIDDDLPELPSVQNVYDRAMEVNYNVKASRQSMVVADEQKRLAKTGYIPQLSFSTGIGSNYYNVSGYENESFGRQMRHNFATYFGLNLSVPIFDKFNTRNSVRRAALQRRQAELDYDNTTSELYKAIQLAYYQANGARQKYIASKETLEKTTLSFNATREKYNLGRATPSEFEQAKNNLYNTEISSVQAYYEYILRYRILRFYERR